MKQTKKLLSVLLCLALVFCLAVPAAFAADPTYTLTINSKTPNHDYQAYRVFSGELAADPSDAGVDTLINIDWGAGVKDTTALLNAVKAITVNGDTPFKDCDDAAAVADVLAAENATAVTDAFADVVARYLADSPTGTGTTAAAATGNDYPATIPGLPAGYYLVKEAAFTGDEGDNNSYTKFILQLVKDKTVNAKADVPTLDKQVKDKGDTAATPADSTNVSVGDTVTYTLTSRVPDMNGYNKYFFVVSDTLSAGLTPNVNSIAVKLNGTALTKDTDYTVSTTPAVPTAGQATTLEIVFKNFIQYNTTTNIGKAIEITYDATVDQYAAAGATGTSNNAKLTFSNDPNYTYVGDPADGDKPATGEPVSETPSTIANVYTAQLQINKVNVENFPLTGAAFTLTGDGVITTGVTASNTFTPDASGTYYKLNSGAYTTTAPDGSNDDLYESTTQKYTRTPGTTSWITKAQGTDVAGEVGADGVVTFTGLGAGTYILKETETPANYNTIDDITLVLNFTPPATVTTGTEKGTWSGTYKVGNGAPQTLTVDSNTGVISLDIENRSGAELPATGGMGTTLFVCGGACLMLAALVVLAVRSASKKNDRHHFKA